MDQVAAHVASTDNEAETSEINVNNEAKDTTQVGDSAKTFQKHIESGDKDQLTPGAAEASEVSESIDDIKETAEVGSIIRLKRCAKPLLKSIENRMQSDSAKLERLWDRFTTQGII